MTRSIRKDLRNNHMMPVSAGNQTYHPNQYTSNQVKII